MYFARPVPVSSCPRSCFPRSHSFIEFDIPEGEGTGPLPGSLYTVSVSVGGQPAPAVPFAYQAPVIDYFTPTSAGTRGGGVMWVYGRNFGVAAPPSVALALSPSASAAMGGTSTAGACANAVRINHTALLCTIPEGGGARLAVTVSIAGLVGAYAFAGGEPGCAGYYLLSRPRRVLCVRSHLCCRADVQLRSPAAGSALSLIRLYHGWVGRPAPMGVLGPGDNGRHPPRWDLCAQWQHDRRLPSHDHGV